jgi:iron complex outermembrane receptor protein
VSASAAQSTGTVRIAVLASDQAVEDAQVVVSGATHRTDATGVVTVNVVPGVITIAIVKPGFLPASTTVQLSPGQQQEVRVELEPEPTVEETVTVIATTRTEKRLEDQPMRVEVLEREEIEEKMLMTPGDIVMMLNEMGGMRPGDRAIARRGERADPGDAGALHARPFRRTASVR